MRRATIIVPAIIFASCAVIQPSEAPPVLESINVEPESVRPIASSVESVLLPAVIVTGRDDRQEKRRLRSVAKLKAQCTDIYTGSLRSDISAKLECLAEEFAQ